MSRSKVKTGDIFQIRSNGRNYVALGKVEKARTGESFVVGTLNGNINPDGTFKKRTGRGKGKIKLFRGNDVKRIHQNRTVDVSSVGRVHSVFSTKLQRTTNRNGIVTQCNNVFETIRELHRDLS